MLSPIRQKNIKNNLSIIEKQHDFWFFSRGEQIYFTQRNDKLLAVLKENGVDKIGEVEYK